MFTLTYASPYTEYTAGQYPDLDACKRALRERYGVKQTVFGQDDQGDLYTVTTCEAGIVVLTMHEVSDAS